MSAQFDSTPGLHLPQPSLAGAQQPAQPVSQMPTQPQQSVFSMPQPVLGQSVAPTPAIQPQIAQPIQQPAQQPQFDALIPNNAQPAMLQQPVAQPEASDNEKDGDALDEEWVTKTKSLLEQYKNDPYALSNAISALKSDYMQARHGVTVKVDKT